MTAERQSTFVPSALARDPLARDRAIDDALDSILTGEKDRHGRRLLAYAPGVKLRSALQLRQFKLAAALTPATPAELAQTVAQMLLGFGVSRAASEEDAELIVTAYVVVLSDLPLWAVQQACHRFASGRVTKDECPDWKRAYAPSTAQLCHVVEALVRSHRREEVRIREVLNGVVERPPPPRSEKVVRGFEELLAGLGRPKRFP